MYVYRAEVLRVVDGDTVQAKVDLGFDVYHNMSLRLAGIDAPEMRTPEGKLAREHLTELLTLQDGPEEPWRPVFLETIKDHTEKYGRYLAWLYLAEPQGGAQGDGSLNQQMIADGFARPYDGGAR